MEIWDVYDKDRCLTGKTMERGGKFKKDQYHLVVHICLFNSKGQVLIQQRQPFKEGWPNLWDITVGGSALAGENSSQAAERELFEEIGFKADFSNTRPFFTIDFSCGFDDYYIVHDDIDIDTLTLQYEEVQCIRWATEDEIINLIDKKEFIPYHTSLIRLLFEIRNNRGAMTD